jgi:dGTPase
MSENPHPLVDGYCEQDWSRLRGCNGSDERSPFARDFDRLIYTPEFRRLQGKTQVAPAGEADFFRTRLTHTLEVAQVARRLAESINRRADAERARVGTPGWIEDPKTVARLPAEQQKVDPDLVEAAAVLHDLGHPPFAHVGESALAAAIEHAAPKWNLTETGSFNGNAQSFRLVTRVLSHHGQARGRQLTFATLDASLKYPWVKGTSGVENPDLWSVNPTEAEELATLRAGLPSELRYVQTIEAQIMDWADDVAYSVHDLDDWNRAGYIPLARLAIDDGEQKRFVDFVVERCDRADPDGLRDRTRGVLNDPTGPLQDFRLAHKRREPIFDATSGAARRAVRRLRGKVFDEAMTRFNVVSRADPSLDIARRYLFAFEPDPAVDFTVSILKQLLRLYVVDDARMATQQHGHRRVIRRLFAVYERAARHEELRMFPLDRRRHMEGTRDDPLERLRSIADYVCDMTDADALRSHERLCTGGTSLHDYA